MTGRWLEPCVWRAGSQMRSESERSSWPQVSSLALLIHLERVCFPVLPAASRLRFGWGSEDALAQSSTLATCLPDPVVGGHVLGRPLPRTQLTRQAKLPSLRSVSAAQAAADGADGGLCVHWQHVPSFPLHPCGGDDVSLTAGHRGQAGDLISTASVGASGGRSQSESEGDRAAEAAQTGRRCVGRNDCGPGRGCLASSLQETAERAACKAFLL